MEWSPTSPTSVDGLLEAAKPAKKPASAPKASENADIENRHRNILSQYGTAIRSPSDRSFVLITTEDSSIVPVMPKTGEVLWKSRMGTVKVSDTDKLTEFFTKDGLFGKFSAAPSGLTVERRDGTRSDYILTTKDIDSRFQTEKTLSPWSDSIDKYAQNIGNGRCVYNGIRGSWIELPNGLSGFIDEDLCLPVDQISSVRIERIDAINSSGDSGFGTSIQVTLSIPESSFDTLKNAPNSNYRFSSSDTSVDVPLFGDRNMSVDWRLNPERLTIGTITIVPQRKKKK